MTGTEESSWRKIKGWMEGIHFLKELLGHAFIGSLFPGRIPL